jgi:hypothetical protein
LFFARLKEPALALLTVAEMPGLTSPYVHYSVDDAVAAALARSS